MVNSATEYLTGAYPDTEHQRLRDRADASFDDAAPSTSVGQATLIRRIPWHMSQGSKPSCVGHAAAMAINSVIAAKRGVPTEDRLTPPPGITWCSGVSIWRDARWRQTARFDQVTRGTRLQYAVDSLCERGWDDYEPGEETDAKEAGERDDLADEMFAYDKRSGDGAERYRIWRRGADRLDQVDAALTDPSLIIIGAWFLRGEFLLAGEAESLPADLFGGGASSHAMAIQGRRVVGERREYLLQNSWRRWGGTREPALRQCCWVPEAAIADTTRCHDLMVVRVKT